ncbi:MAG: tripartite tricarboxylate transporter TctB family protein [Rhizobiales bacterium]|nr:tripartite tricarboxylate transporter TctB family protein [Hyphomicrobiales bacterium]
MRNLLKFFLSKENLLASIFLIILLFYFFSSLNLEKTIGEDVVGPSSFPIIISLIGTVLVLFLFLQNFKKKNKIINEKNNSIKENINKLSPILITIIFVLTFELIGFIFSSLIYSFLFIYYLNRNLKIALIFSIFITFVIFILFYYGLNFQMPMGTLINTDEVFPFLKAIKKSIY